MKTKILKLAAFALLLAGTLLACESKGEESQIVILPATPADENIIVFFSVALPATAVSDCFFTETGSDTCCIVNSMYELKKMCTCQDGLPEINFNIYTLVVGKKKMPNSFYTVSEQKIIEMSSSQTLTVKLSLEDHWPAFSTLYHWGLYPKLSNNKKLNVEYLF
jgi:hypothetical protein